MTALLAGVLGASLVGSLHCAGMCGPLVVYCGGAERPSAAALSAYHLARLVGYMALGLAAGAVGAAVDFGGEAAGFGRAAAVFAGSFMVLAGLSTFLGPRLAFWRKRAGKPGRLSLAVTKAMGRASKWGVFERSLSIGALTAFLPCGWLYAFLAAAASTGAPVSGALVMSAFWAGSVPILLGVGVGAGSLLGPLRRRAPAVVSALLIGLGLFTLSGRLSVPSFAASLGPDAGARALSGELDQAQLPCCSGEVSVSKADCPCCADGACESDGDCACTPEAASAPTEDAE